MNEFEIKSSAMQSIDLSAGPNQAEMLVFEILYSFRSILIVLKTKERVLLRIIARNADGVQNEVFRVKKKKTVKKSHLSYHRLL